MEFMEIVFAIVVALLVVKALSYVIPEEYEIWVWGICLLALIVGAAMRGSMVAAWILLVVLIWWIIYALSDNKGIRKFIKSIRWDVVWSIALVVAVVIAANLMK